MRFMIDSRDFGTSSPTRYFEAHGQGARARCGRLHGYGADGAP